MCGRFVATQSPDQIAEFFGAAAPRSSADLPPNYNVAPTNDVYGVLQDLDGLRSVEAFHWGLVPTWAKDTKIGSRMINARSETIAEKPAFRSLLRTHRLIVPMDGFYEWQAGRDGAPLTKQGTPMKTPMYIHRADGEPLAVAGLWAAWRDRALGDDAPWLHSCTVITTSANTTMEPVHDRMPVILPPDAWDAWLDPTNQDPALLRSLLLPAADDVLVMHAVSTAVNSVRNKGCELIDPVPATTAETDASTLGL